MHPPDALDLDEAKSTQQSLDGRKILWWRVSARREDVEVTVGDETHTLGTLCKLSGRERGAPLR